MTEPGSAALCYSCRTDPCRCDVKDRPSYAPVLRIPLDERLALALAEDCHTELDDADIANVVAAVLPVARRYGARDEVPRNG